MSAPTARRLQLLRLIHTHIAAKGYAPSVRDVQERLGLASTNGVAEHISALIRDGFLERREPFVARALVLTQKARDLLAAEKAVAA